jgi:hypothetical protein
MLQSDPRGGAAEEWMRAAGSRRARCRSIRTPRSGPTAIIDRVRLFRVPIRDRPDRHREAGRFRLVCCRQGLRGNSRIVGILANYTLSEITFEMVPGISGPRAVATRSPDVRVVARIISKLAKEEILGCGDVQPAVLAAVEAG